MTDQAKNNEAITDMLTTANEERSASNSGLRALHNRVSSIEDALKSNTKLTQAMVEDTRELLELFRAAKGGLKVVGWLGEGLKWAGIIAAALTSIWLALHQGPGK